MKCLDEGSIGPVINTLQWPFILMKLLIKIFILKIFMWFISKFVLTFFFTLQDNFNLNVTIDLWHFRVAYVFLFSLMLKSSYPYGHKRSSSDWCTCKLFLTFEQTVMLYVFSTPISCIQYFSPHLPIFPLLHFFLISFLTPISYTCFLLFFFLLLTSSWEPPTFLSLFFAHHSSFNFAISAVSPLYIIFSLSFHRTFSSSSPVWHWSALFFSSLRPFPSPIPLSVWVSRAVYASSVAAITASLCI